MEATFIAYFENVSFQLKLLVMPGKVIALFWIRPDIITQWSFCIYVEMFL